MPETRFPGGRRLDTTPTPHPLGAEPDRVVG